MVPDHVFRGLRTTAVHWSCIVLAFQTKARTGARVLAQTLRLYRYGLNAAKKKSRFITWILRKKKNRCSSVVKPTRILGVFHLMTIGANSATWSLAGSRLRHNFPGVYTNDNFMNKKHTCAMNIATKCNSVTSNHNSKGDILSS